MKGAKAITTLASTVKTLNASRKTGPANVLVLYRSGDATGQSVANYYQSQRGIPSGQVAAVTMTWTGGGQITQSDMTGVLNQVCGLLTSYPNILFIVTVGSWPGFVQTSNQSLDYVLSFPFWFQANGYVAGNPPSNRSNRLWPTDYTADYPTSYLYQGGNLGGTEGTSAALSFGQYLAVGGYTNAPFYGLMRYPSSLGTNTPYAHFRLETTPVDPADPTTQTQYLHRLIDDAIYAEGQSYQNFGTVVLSGSGSYSGALDAAVPIAQELGYCGAPSTLYHENLNLEVLSILRSTTFASGLVGTSFREPVSNNLFILVTAGTTAAGAPTWPTTVGAQVTDGTCVWQLTYVQPANAFPPSSTALANRFSGGFQPISTVFLHLMSDYMTTATPQSRTDFTYKRGAIFLATQSYSFVGPMVCGRDFEYGNATLTNAAATPCVSPTAVILHCVSGTGNAAVFSVTCTTAGATVAVANNVVTFTDSVIGSVPITVSGSLRNMLSQMRSGMAAHNAWTIVTGDAFYTSDAASGNAESRCSAAIKAGACIAIGSNAEPQVDGAIKAHHIVSGLWAGQSIGEVVFRMAVDPKYTTRVGDPLTRWFGYRQ